MLGLKRGDRVAMWAPSVPEWVLTQFACARAGLVLVTMNPVYSALETISHPWQKKRKP